MAVLIVKFDSITPLLRSLSQYWSKPDDFTKVCTDALLEDTRAFYREKGSGFWGGISEAFEPHPVSGVARISVMGEKGAILLHKINGGTVYPKPPHKYLAIPARSEAQKLGWPSHWSSPGDGKLEAVFGRGRKVVGLALAQNFGSGKKFKLARAKKGQGIHTKSACGQGLLMYWLVKSAFHPPDPEALPPPERTKAAVLDAARARATEMLKTGRKA